MNTNRPITQNGDSALAHLARARAEVERAAECGYADRAKYDGALAVLDALGDAESATLPIRRAALAEELMKIGARLNAERNFDAVASRLADLARHIKTWGVVDGDTDEIEF